MELNKEMNEKVEQFVLGKKLLEEKMSKMEAQYEEKLEKKLQHYKLMQVQVSNASHTP